MSSERWRLVERLYHGALERPAEARPAFLADACAGDEALARDVQSLLDQASIPGFLEEPALALAVALAAATETPEPPWVGRHIGVYHLQSLLGRGGMGEVYRAHDTRLGRDVALKLLPPGFTADAERLARFTREARLLASLNHLNIGTIHGFEEAEGMRALVLELVEGDTLADRVARGPLPIPETLAIARQIADALEAAHDKGVVHRDLKPANIKITPDGVIKVLDFGLAKSDPGGASELANSPTITVGGTVAGLILGTAAYMSPEQARGRVVDKRTDVWAFGCVLYELLTGRQAFPGETVSDTIGAILNREPDWNQLPRDLPPSVLTLLRRCLEKDAKKRKRDIGDARAEIDDALARPSADRAAGDASKASTAVVRRHSVVPWLVAAAGLIAAAVAWWPGTASTDAWQNPLADATFKYLTSFPGTESDAAISPDGRFVAFLADRDGKFEVFLTQIETGTPTPLTKGNGDESPRRGGAGGAASPSRRTASELAVSGSPTGTAGAADRRRAAAVSWQERQRCVVVSRWQPHGLHDQYRRRSDHGRGPPWCESDSDLPKRKWAPQSCASLVYRWTVDLLHPRHPERQPHEHLASTADGGRARSVDRPRDRHVARAARPAHGVVHGARSGGRRPVAVGARHGNANIAPGDPGPRAVHLDRGVRRWATARRVRRQTARRTLDRADHGEAHHR